MARRFTLLLLVIICCASLGSLQSAHAATPWSGLTDYTIQVGSYQRVYHVHIPVSYTGTTPLPLVVALHGSKDNGPNMSGLTHFNTVADTYGVIATYPDALKGTWNTDGTAPQDDFAFISAMIQQISGTFMVNSHQVYTMGFSNGATFSEELGCKLSSTFAAVASVSGHMPSTYVCALAHPMPLITFHGTVDPIYSYTGWGSTRNGKHLMGATDAENMWASLSSCTAPAVTTNLPDVVLTDGTTEQLTVTGGCAGGVQMQLYTIIGGGHTWPGGLQYSSVRAIGITSLDLDASVLIWQFFAPYQS
ncbi:MAG: hypothetical protein H0X37_26055 [Herpetosiphonaceae bacterium]|nr:hypothetical protein [Herpetosiphonaceae bacterium]